MNHSRARITALYCTRTISHIPISIPFSFYFFDEHWGLHQLGVRDVILLPNNQQRFKRHTQSRPDATGWIQRRTATARESLTRELQVVSSKRIEAVHGVYVRMSQAEKVRQHYKPRLACGWCLGHGPTSIPRQIHMLAV